MDANALLSDTQKEIASAEIVRGVLDQVAGSKQHK